eukprot:scaffold1252_cov66-Cyclotella_meneghiniana.AAC.3
MMKTFLIALSLLISSVALTVVGNNDFFQLALYYDLPEEEEIRSNTQQRISNQRKATWRIQHNNMRKKYQVEFGGRYKALRWNTALEDEAHAWAQEIVQTCVNAAPGSEENPNNWGFNSAAQKGTRDFRPVQSIMKMWEKTLERGYPNNKVMTQVLWRSTKFVGCSDASSPIDSNKTCTASAGNCLFKKYGNWTNAVMNAPGCSSVCPEGVNNC